MGPRLLLWRRLLCTRRGRLLLRLLSALRWLLLRLLSPRLVLLLSLRLLSPRLLLLALFGLLSPLLRSLLGLPILRLLRARLWLPLLPLLLSAFFLLIALPLMLGIHGSYRAIQ